MNRSSYPSINELFKNLPRGTLFGGLLVIALLAFEIFNYSTTDFALRDVLGSELKFAGVRWATILSIAFCGIDFAGIARLFTPEKGREEPTEVWYLFGAWLLAAAMNACLTWWGISVAVMNHTVAGSSLVSQATLVKVVPVFVAVMVWLIRVLIIGTLSMAGDRIFSMGTSASERPFAKAMRPSAAPRPAAAPARPQTFEPAPWHDSEDDEDMPAPARPAPQHFEPGYRHQPQRRPFEQNPWPGEPEEDEDGPAAPPPPSQRSEPSYHPIGLAARNHDPRAKMRR